MNGSGGGGSGYEREMDGVGGGRWRVVKVSERDGVIWLNSLSIIVYLEDQQDWCHL